MQLVDFETMQLLTLILMSRFNALDVYTALPCTITSVKRTILCFCTYVLSSIFYFFNVIYVHKDYPWEL